MSVQGGKTTPVVAANKKLSTAAKGDHLFLQRNDDGNYKLVLLPTESGKNYYNDILFLFMYT